MPEGLCVVFCVAQAAACHAVVGVLLVSDVAECETPHQNQESKVLGATSSLRFVLRVMLACHLRCSTAAVIQS
jgi:hypothetical protein